MPRLADKPVAHPKICQLEIMDGIFIYLTSAVVNDWFFRGTQIQSM